MLRLALQSKGVNLPESTHMHSQEHAPQPLPSQRSALNDDDVPNEQGQPPPAETHVDRTDVDTVEGVFL